MGRELRRVAPNWEHPKDLLGHYIPKHDRSFEAAAAEWKAGYAAWERGEHYNGAGDFNGEFWEWDGGPPDREAHMPNWTDAERTHFQMYEDTTEGTPVSPVFDSIDKVARWCADNGASVFGSTTATYERWLQICKDSSASLLVLTIPVAE